MSPKDQLIQELEGVSDALVMEVLDFLQFLKAKKATESLPLSSSQSPQTDLKTGNITSPQVHDSETGLPIIKAIYTDGACAGNPGPGGWGTVLYLADGTVHEMGGGDRQTTNNRMEMQAAIAGLEFLIAADQTVPVEVFTDSEYVKKGITQWIAGWKRRGWQTSAKKPVLNQDLWQQLDQANQIATQRTGSPVQWIYVRGHSGNEGNERCDEIARSFSEGRPISLRQHPQAIAIEKALSAK